ncbi:hypothetical protein HAPAU_34630 [Halalkalicoccus paucihalophilus]|uniref:Enolase C-terminal domain-containing protein n=1 Tax=Halalkalicoccus paucihalophilus TaxID=1008153 RepID=A0A151AAA4_9EURY|nr:hypothetical protein [Halalkalicoccus paucihalophilus]KYH24480.1 hypothetical protein HAPAU_34630 [Halalkalicoccus paucihalophilus]
MEIDVKRAERYVSNLDKRMAFHFGNVVATEGPHHFLELTLGIDDEEATGLSMVGMAPMWFLKEPELSLAEATTALLDVFRAATETALRQEPSSTVFDLWYDLFERQRVWAVGTSHPPLLWAYGVSMVEQAVIDAFCRHYGITFAEAVRSDVLGVEPGRIYDELEGVSLATYLPDEPTRDAAVRHTVGLSDPLEPDEMSEDDRLDDGLPQALSTYVDRQGIDHFKIKLSADAERDADRLARIGAVLEASSLESYRCTLDANEQYDTVRAFKDQWERHATDPSLAAVVDHVAYVEQPLPRAAALTDRTRDVLTDWEGRPPIIIDESDDDLDSAGRALECGYAGTSHKNCKGVFKGLINASLIEKRRQEDGGEYLMSGEDLTTIGPVELLQDLAVMGTMGLDHIERNGHHYYRGLSFLPEDLQTRVLEAHDDLYRRHEDGFVTMAVEDGRFRFGSVIDAPFGRGFDLDPSRFTPVEEWDVDSMLA